jgi:pilus assembly protein CpaE
MVKILVIDDEPIYHKLTQRALALPDYEFVFANNGTEGIQAAKTARPDVIITDLKMPDIDGYEVVSTLRRDTNFAHIPIMILTANTELEDKLNAFEKGADDYISKPFNPNELQARVRVLVQRGEVAKTARTLISSTEEIENYTLAVHSLRGGMGSSSIAMNLALGLTGLWGRPTLLVDGVLNSGQIALLLNTSSKRTWADLSIPKDEAPDEIVLQSIISKHETGLHYIASPAFPVDAEVVSPHAVKSVLNWATDHYDYTVIDAAHSFDPITLPMLDMADTILLVLAPEMASIRAAAAALNTYKQLDYPPEKIRLVLNWTFKRRGLAHKQIEKALKRKISLIIPHAPDIFIGAINMGRPIVTHQVEHPIGILFENTAYQLSSESHRNLPPIQPSDMWNRVNQRLKR